MPHPNPSPTASSALPPALRRSILLLSFATFSSMATQRVCDAMLPELSRTFGVSLVQAARVVSLFAVVYGLSQLFYGPLGDRLGKFKVVTYATLGCSVGSVVAAFATGLNMLLLARVLVALGAAALIPLSLAWVGDSVRYEQRQATLARLGLGSTLGIVGGQLLGGVFSDTLGWRWAFVFMTVLFAVVGLLLLWDWRRQLAQGGLPASVDVPANGSMAFAGQASDSEAAGKVGTIRTVGVMEAAAAAGGVGAKVADATAVLATESSSASGSGFVQRAMGIATGRWARVVLAVAFVEGAAGFGVLAIWASHLHQSLGLSLSASGGVVALFGLGGMLYMVLAPWLIPRLRERGLAAVGGVLVAVFAAVLAYSPFWVLDLAASLMAGFGFFMFHNTMQTHATQMAPQARGTAVSLFSACLFMGQSSGVLCAATLAVSLGSALTIALGGAVVLGAALYFSHALQHRERLLAESLQPPSAGA